MFDHETSTDNAVSRLAVWMPCWKLIHEYHSNWLSNIFSMGFLTIMSVFFWYLSFYVYVDCVYVNYIYIHKTSIYDNNHSFIFLDASVFDHFITALKTTNQAAIATKLEQETTLSPGCKYQLSLLYLFHSLNCCDGFINGYREYMLLYWRS